MAKEYTFKVRYYGMDGAPCSFTFKSSRRMAAYNTTGTFGHPFLIDMAKAAKRYEADETSAMHRHGGFMLTKVRSVENLDTGEIRRFA